MPIKEIRLVLPTTFIICCSVSCTITTNLNEDGNSMPGDWSVAVAQTPVECVSIDGEYKTFGLGKFEENDGLTQARFDAALGYPFPSAEIPEKVSISFDPASSLLNIQFEDPVNLGVLISVNCVDGWYEFEDRSTNQYLGDGTTLDYSISKFELGTSIDGDLILHKVFDIQSSSFLVFRSRDIGETWSKYEPSSTSE